MKHIKMKRITAVLLICGILCLSLLGCGKQPGSPVQENTLEITEPRAQAASGNIDSNIQTSQTDGGNVPVSDGEYVYDYQVSMDPIPKEIADLGGPCQGTIHAFPSKIEMGLTQRMMEEDPELKAEVEKRIPEVEQALKEEFGGEFRVDGVIALEGLDWEWFCTEIRTGHQFSIGYFNFEYMSKKEGLSLYSSNRLFFSGYYETERTAEIAPQIEPMIIDVFEDCCYNIRIQGGIEAADIYIVQFTDASIDRANEQVKILNLWQKLQDYDKERTYNLFLLYFPTDYKEVVQQKYQEGTLEDMRLGDDVDSIYNMIQAGEIKDIFAYFIFWNTDKELTMDELLNQYQKGSLFKDKDWKYWISNS